MVTVIGLDLVLELDPGSQILMGIMWDKTLVHLANSL